MYLHLGQSVVVPFSSIVGIFDLDTTTVGKETRLFLERAERAGDLVEVTRDLPKSFAVCAEHGRKQAVYLSQLASQTLKKRAELGVME